MIQARQEEIREEERRGEERMRREEERRREEVRREEQERRTGSRSWIRNWIHGAGEAGARETGAALPVASGVQGLHVGGSATAAVRLLSY